jgi:hypothetical protein
VSIAKSKKNIGQGMNNKTLPGAAAARKAQ